jgi:hypothetical protein
MTSEIIQLYGYKNIGHLPFKATLEVDNCGIFLLTLFHLLCSQGVNLF